MAKQFEPWTIVLRLTGIGWYVATCIVFGVVGGVFLDKFAGTTPLFILLGTVLGSVVAFWGLYKMVQPILNASKGPDLQKRDPEKRDPEKQDMEDQGRKR